MKKIIRFNALLSYQYYDEDGKFLHIDSLIQKLAEEAGYVVVNEGDGTKPERQMDNYLQQLQQSTKDEDLL